MTSTVNGVGTTPFAPPSGAPRAPANPFVGPRSIQYGERIYGRDREIGELRDVLIADRIVLMYSPSGAGKTSLINAGLRPELERRDFQVMPTIRVGLDVDDLIGADGVGNRYLLSTMLSLEESQPPDRLLPPARLLEMSLVDYLGHLSAGIDDGLDPCLVFDQFEELVTLDPTDQVRKTEFMEQLGLALRDRGWWALFSMREDFVAQFDPFVSHISNKLRTRYRLDQLGATAAKAAAQNATQDVGVHFSERAADQLIDDLRRVRVERGGSAVEEPGPYVEPVQLQVVCRQLWNRLALPPGSSIELDDVVSLGDVDDALGDFYEERIRFVESETGVSEREIRQWIDDELISEQGFRTQSLNGPGEAGPEVLRTLEDAHLIRAETRRGTQWFELAHDRLVEPIRNANSRWRTEHLSTLQAKAIEWESQDRSSGLLIGDKVLVDADEWAEHHAAELMPIDHEYLEACHDREFRLRAIRRSERRNRMLARAALLALLVAVVVGIWVFVLQQRAKNAQDDAERARAAAVQSEAEALEAKHIAEHAQAEAEAKELAATTKVLERENPALALAVAAESTAIPHHPIPDSVTAIVGGRVAFSDRTWQTVGDPVPQDGAREVAISPDGTVVASAGNAPNCEGADNPCRRDTIYLRPMSDLNAAPTLFTGHTGLIWDLAFSPDGERLASAAADGTVRLWDAATGDEVERLDHTTDGEANNCCAISFHPEGTMLTSGDESGRAWLWDLTVSPPSSVVLNESTADPENTVNDVEFRHDGKLIAVAYEDGTVTLVDWLSQTVQARLVLPSRGDVAPLPALRVAFHPEPDPACTTPDWGAPCIDVLVASYQGGDIWRWEIPNSRTPTAILMSGHTKDVRGLSFGRADVLSPDGGVDTILLASSSGDRTIRLWSFERLSNGSLEVSQVGPPLRKHLEFVSDVAFSPDGLRLVSSSTDDTLRLWGIPSPAEVGVTTLGEPSCRDGDCFATSVAFSADDRLLASGGIDGRIRIWDPDTGTTVADPIEVSGGVYALAFHPTEDVLIAGGYGQVFLWTADDPAVPTTLWEHETVSAWREGEIDADRVPAVRAVAFDANSGLAASSDECGVVRIWDTAQRTEVDRAMITERSCPEFPSTSTTVDALAFGAGALFVGDGTGHVWELPFDEKSGRLGNPQEIGLHLGNVRGIGVSDDGRLLASGAADQTVRLWDRSSDAGPVVLGGHTAAVGAIAFHPDNDLVASASNDGSVRLWSLLSGEVGVELVAWSPEFGRPLSAELPPSENCGTLDDCFALGVAFSHDGSKLAVASSEGNVALWDRLADPLVACDIAEAFVSERQLTDEIGSDAQLCF